MRMYEVIDREKVLLETPEVLIDRVDKSIPRDRTAWYMNELAKKIVEAGEDGAEEEDLVLLWRASCRMLHGRLSPVKDDANFMDYEDRNQDMYIMMIEVLFGGKDYGAELYTEAINNYLGWKVRDTYDLAKNDYVHIGMSEAEEANEPVLAIFMEDASNMREYLQKNYGDFAAEWFYLKFVCGYKDKEIAERNEMPYRTHKWRVSELKKKMVKDSALKELWEEL